MKPYIITIAAKPWLAKMRYDGLYGRHVNKALCTSKVMYLLTDLLDN